MPGRAGRPRPRRRSGSAPGPCWSPRRWRSPSTGPAGSGPGGLGAPCGRREPGDRFLDLLRRHLHRLGQPFAAPAEVDSDRRRRPREPWHVRHDLTSGVVDPHPDVRPAAHGGCSSRTTPAGPVSARGRPGCRATSTAKPWVVATAVQNRGGRSVRRGSTADRRRERRDVTKDAGGRVRTYGCVAWPRWLRSFIRPSCWRPRPCSGCWTCGCG